MISKWLLGASTIMTSFGGALCCLHCVSKVSGSFKNLMSLVSRIFVGPACAVNVCSSSLRLVCGDPRISIPIMCTFDELMDASLSNPP